MNGLIGLPGPRGAQGERGPPGASGSDGKPVCMPADYMSPFPADQLTFRMSLCNLFNASLFTSGERFFRRFYSAGLRRRAEK